LEDQVERFPTSARPPNVASPRLSLTGAFHVKSQPVAFPYGEWIDACGFQRADMQEQVRAAGVVADEAITSLGVPHFQFSGSHRVLFSLFQPELDQAADGLRPRGHVILLAAPVINQLEEGRVYANADLRIFSKPGPVLATPRPGSNPSQRMMKPWLKLMITIP
jgi:hypothetical protein